MAALGFLLHHGHASSIHLEIKNGDRFTHDYGQIQLHGAIDLLLLALCDVSADRFDRSRDGLGGDLQARQQLHLFPTVIEGGVLSHQRLHAPHTGRELRVLDIQFLVGRKLALVAMGTQIPGPRDFHCAQSGQHAPRAEFAVPRLVTAATGNAALLRHWLAEA